MITKHNPPGGESQGADKSFGGSGSSLPGIPGYVVLMITRYGMPRRKVYLDLGYARAAVARAQAKGQPARLVLCQLRPVDPDLDLGSEAES
jgi:hypothetical protein